MEEGGRTRGKKEEKKGRKKREEETKPMVDGSSGQGSTSSSHGFAIPRNDGLGMDLHSNKLLGLPQELSSKHGHTRCSIPNLFVLYLGDVWRKTHA